MGLFGGAGGVFDDYLGELKNEYKSKEIDDIFCHLGGQWFDGVTCIPRIFLLS